MIYIGIDPGQDGAVGVIAESLVRVFDCPDNVVEMAKLLRKCNVNGRIRAAIEDAPQTLRIAMKVKGQTKKTSRTVSTAKLNRNCGDWRGICAALGIPFEMVPPKKWQKVLDNPAKWPNKKRSFDMASRLFPQAQLKGPRGGVKDGRCDALLIAEWLRRQR